MYLSSRDKARERNPLFSFSRLALRLICTQNRGKKKKPWNQKKAMTEICMRVRVCACLNSVSYPTREYH